jgi:hypothetical protein
MLSESARMSSAAEAKFRLREPARATRTVKVLALDEASDGVVARLAEHPGREAAFFPASALLPLTAAPGADVPMADRQARVLEQAAEADLVVMVASEGGRADAAAIIGAVCSQNRVMTMTLLVHHADATEDAISRTLAQVRRWSLMIVVASDEQYVADILRSFR